MIERYTLPEMKELWSDESKFKIWLEIEILACEARAELGEIPSGTVDRIRQKARIDVKRIQEIEEKVRHDLIAFLESLNEQLGEEAKYIHSGLTSYDIEDTALAIRMRSSVDYIIKGIDKLQNVLEEKALRYRDTAMIGRTHGMHAQPTTFGLKMALMLSEMRRNRGRILEMRKSINCGKLSGAVGTYAHCPPFVEKYVCGKLGLDAATVSTQILQRDRHAHFLCSLAILASSLDKFSEEVRLLQRTEVSELEEPFLSKQKGSSAMPHKRNPIVCERICGLARIVRSNAQAGLENVALWHERDLSNSSAERVIIPDSSILVHYMLTKFSEVIEGLVVYPGRMLQNLELTRGLIFSQKVLISLVDGGLPRDRAYEIVQRCAVRSHKEGIHFRDALSEEPEVKKFLGDEQLKDCFDLKFMLRNIGEIFSRFEYRDFNNSDTD